MRKICFLFVLLFMVQQLLKAQQTMNTPPRHEVLLETTMGNIRLQLYNETPLHRDNFLKLVKAKKFDGELFHRVIKDFMIQSGDPYSKKAKSGEMLGEHQDGKDFTAEILFPLFYHKRGALAAARQPDNINPKRKSSGSQFYIVWGHKWSDSQLNSYEKKRDSLSNDTAFKFTPEMRKTYKQIGGTPFLDGQYTVFGEVVDGLDVVDHIQQAETDKNDRPVSDIRIIRATIEK